MTNLVVTPLARALGADVNVEVRNANGVTINQIREAWRKHLVLRFRNQSFTDPELLKCSQLSGTLDLPGSNPYGVPYTPEHSEINVISNVKHNGDPIGSLGEGETAWHCDMTVEAAVMARVPFAGTNWIPGWSDR